MALATSGTVQLLTLVRMTSGTSAASTKGQPTRRTMASVISVASEAQTTPQVAVISVILVTALALATRMDSATSGALGTTSASGRWEDPEAPVVGAIGACRGHGRAVPT